MSIYGVIVLLVLPTLINSIPLSMTTPRIPRTETRLLLAEFTPVTALTDIQTAESGWHPQGSAVFSNFGLTEGRLHHNPFTKSGWKPTTNSGWRPTMQSGWRDQYQGYAYGMGGYNMGSYIGTYVGQNGGRYGAISTGYEGTRGYGWRN